MVTTVIVIFGALTVLFPFALIAVPVTILAGFEFWRGTLRKAGKFWIGPKPLVVAYLMFGVGWLATAFAVAIIDPPGLDEAIPFLSDTVTGKAGGIFVGGSLLAVVIFTVGGLPALGRLVRRNRLGYRNGATTVALFIVAGGLVVWIDPELGAPGIGGLVQAIGIACLFLLLPAGGGMAGLVFSYRRRELDRHPSARQRSRAVPPSGGSAL